MKETEGISWRDPGTITDIVMFNLPHSFYLHWIIGWHESQNTPETTLCCCWNEFKQLIFLEGFWTFVRQKRIGMRKVEHPSMFLFADFIFSAPIFSSQLGTSKTEPLGKYVHCSSEPVNHIYLNVQLCFSPFVCRLWVSALTKKNNPCATVSSSFHVVSKRVWFHASSTSPHFHTHTHSVSCRHSWLSGTIGVNLAGTAVTSGGHTYTHRHRETRTHTFVQSHTFFILFHVTYTTARYALYAGDSRG